MSKQKEERSNAQVIKIEKESIKTPENWMQIYEKWQGVSNRYFMAYAKSWQMILVSNPDSLIYDESDRWICPMCDKS